MRPTRAGLSPRVRGNRNGPLPGQKPPRSIPACAGEPCPTPPSTTGYGVYPRVCGGTSPSTARWYATYGLSPRVRGNHLPVHPVYAMSRSIPACAGEPTCGSSGTCIGRVYPRVCGGTRPPSHGCSGGSGLSPRVRGNQPGNDVNAVREGSIPACAGEPSLSPRLRYGCRVYPRVCGGTSGHNDDGGWQAGLSPRVRGNPVIVV